MTTLKIGIASYEEMKARTLAVARGTLRVAPDDPRVWFTSTEAVAKVLLGGRQRPAAADPGTGALARRPCLTVRALAGIPRGLS